MTKKFVVSDEELEDLIHRYCRDYTALAREDYFDPITGRDEELDQIILILLQKGRKNVGIIGPAGVGKSALVVGLAQTVVKGKVPEYLRNARVLEVDLARMAAGTSSIAEFHGRFIPICKAVAERYRDPSYPKFIMFVDEFHTIMPTFEGSSYKGLSEVLKPYMMVGDLHIIGATTLDEYRVYVALDPAMSRRFQQVILSIPNAAETLNIMRALSPSYAKYHGIDIPDEELSRIVKLTEEYLRRRNQPDKSILMMDASCAYHVKEFGRGSVLTKESIYQMMSKECGVHPSALE